MRTLPTRNEKAGSAGHVLADLSPFRPNVTVSQPRTLLLCLIFEESQERLTATVRQHQMLGRQVLNGIKRHILVDTLGLLLIVVVHTADIQDRDGGKLVLARIKNRFPRLRLLWADGGYAGKLIEYVYYWYFIILQIVKRSDPLPGFKVLPRRWVVERTFGWLMNYRRLCRYYEYWPETGEAMVKIAMIHVMLRRLA